MKKGEIRKQEILSTAEELFCRKGYEQTSIQDIIDRLNTSKGSFYHHFASKDSLLEGICDNRAEQILQSVLSESNQSDSSAERLNALLSGMIPFKNEKLRFLMMLLPVFSLPEGRLLRMYYAESLAARFHSPVRAEIARGSVIGELCCDDPENAAMIVLFLVNRMWISITDLIIEEEKTHSAPDFSEYLRLTECCRTCLERFLSLPYGSIVLTDLPLLRNLIVQVHNHWTYNNQKIQS